VIGLTARHPGESVEQCAKNPRPCCKYARHLGILHNKEGAQTIIIISDNEACGIDSALCVSRRLCALRFRASAAADAPPPESPPKTTTLLFSITMPAPCLPVGNVWPVWRKLLAPASSLPFAPASATGTVQEAASRISKGERRFILTGDP
jgi:hypothetical protein